MKVGESVRKAIDDWMEGELESAILHASNAVDGTAKKTYPTLGVRARFTRLLRENYGILGPMAAPGFDLYNTRFPVGERQLDYAEIVYSVHRCCHGHGDELPAGFELVRDAEGPPRITRMVVTDGSVRLSDRVIFGLLAVAILAPVNRGQTVPDDYFLTFGSETMLPINDWWGRRDHFPEVVQEDPTPLVTFDFGDWGSS